MKSSDITLGNAPAPEAGAELSAALQSGETLPALRPDLDQEVKNAQIVQGAVNEIAALQFQAAQLIGRIEAMDAVSQFTMAGRSFYFKQVKDSKAYKGMIIPRADGSTVKIATFEEFCELMGTSRRKVDEDILNLKNFGEAFIERAEKIHLSYRDFRQLRTLPEADRAAITEEEDPEVLKDKLTKALEEREAARKEAEEAKKTAEARDEMIAELHQGKKELKEALLKLKSIPPDERAALQNEKEQLALKQLYDHGIEFLGYFSVFANQAVGILEDTDVSVHARDEVLRLTSGLCRRFADALLEAGIDIDFRMIVWPDDTPLRGNGEDAPDDEDDTE